MPPQWDVPKRRNGLSAPYSLPQIASWIFLAATVIEFLLFISPILPVGASVALTLFFLALVAIVCFYGLRVLAVDSMDVYLKQSLCEHRNGQIKQESKFLDRLYVHYNGNCQSAKKEVVPDNEETKQCWICDTQVADHAMHCKYCNKCVSHFDHHCMWLNTCVGDKNYKYFFRVMLSIFAMQIVHFSISLGLVIDIFIHGPTEDRADEWLGASAASPGVAAVLILFMWFDLVSLVLLAQLILFHVRLQKDGITTYQYIVRDGQKRREQGKLLMELHHQREFELSQAEEEKNHWYAFRLKSGAKFREWGCGRLDPLEMPQAPPEPDPNDGFAASLGSPVINGEGQSPSNEQTASADDDETQSIENGLSQQVSNEVVVMEDVVANADENDPQEYGVTFLPVGVIGGLTNEKHELDSQPSQSELGDIDTEDELDYAAEDQPHETSATFMPVGVRGDMTNEKHELDSQPSQSEVGESEDELESAMK